MTGLLAVAHPLTARAATTGDSPTATSTTAATGSGSGTATPAVAGSDDRNVLQKAWAAVKDVVTGDDEAGGATADDATPAATEVAALPVTSNSTASTAEGFVHSVGVNTHVSYRDTSYGDVDVTKLVEDLGVLHVRDGLGSSDSTPVATLKSLGEAGVDVDWVSQPEDSSFSIDDQVKLIEDNHLPVTSVEGVNERDNHGDPDWAGKVRDHQTRLYSAVKSSLGDGVAVVAPSLVYEGSRAELGAVPADIANSHPYTGAEMQTAAQTEHEVSLAKQVTPGVDTAAPEQGEAGGVQAAVDQEGAMWATETGFHTAAGSTAGNGVQPHVSEKAQTVLELQQLLANYANGIDRSYVYELLDEGDDAGEAEKSFGLFHSDGSPKPVATALKNLLATVGSGGPSGTAGAAPVSVDVTGGSDVTTRLVLPRADGSTVVAVWEASPVWDRDAGRDLDVPAHDVTLALGSSVDAQVFVPGQGAQAVDSATGTTSVQVSSQATPTIVVLAPTGAGGSAMSTGTASPSASTSSPSATSTGTASPSATGTGTASPSASSTGATSTASPSTASPSATSTSTASTGADTSATDAPTGSPTSAPATPTRSQEPSDTASAPESGDSGSERRGQDDTHR